MAIKAKEEIMATMPVMILQIVINLILDWLLIVHFNFGVWGGMGAVAGTFLISAPIRLSVVKKILGGIFFPTAYMLRMTLTLFALSSVLIVASNHWNLLGLFATRWLNIVTLFGLGALYLLLFLVCVRLFRLVRDEDVADFRALDIKKLNFVFDLLSPRKS